MGRLLALVLSLACLVMMVVTVVTGRQNRKLQDELQKASNALREEQTALQEGARSLAPFEQIGPSVIQEMGAIARSNVEMRVLLAKHGITLNTNATPAAAATTPVAKSAKASEAKLETPAEAVAPVAPKTEKTAAGKTNKPAAEVVSPPVGAGDGNNKN